MTTPCAWCGRPTPAQRRGRKGGRTFCPGPTCRQAFYGAAVKIGAALLQGTEGRQTGAERARELQINSAEASER